MGSRWHGGRSRHRRLRALVDAYDGDAHQLLADVAGQLGASVAYVDRATVEAHLERRLSSTEWAAIGGHLAPMAFDEQVGEAGTFRTDWIDEVLSRAGVPGVPPAASRAARPVDGSMP